MKDEEMKLVKETLLSLEMEEGIIDDDFLGHSDEDVTIVAVDGTSMAPSYTHKGFSSTKKTGHAETYASFLPSSLIGHHFFIP
jgi:hypothetical protein